MRPSRPTTSASKITCPKNLEKLFLNLFQTSKAGQGIHKVDQFHATMKLVVCEILNKSKLVIHSHHLSCYNSMQTNILIIHTKKNFIMIQLK